MAKRNAGLVTMGRKLNCLEDNIIDAVPTSANTPVHPQKEKERETHNESMVRHSHPAIPYFRGGWVVVTREP